MEGVLGVRKGAWSEAEDVLLKRCVESYGEGNWHKVPVRAGLNRCRKSCRLRWVNYLRPNIKRGHFEEDEVDLIMKLHSLLGNRWSMIAGRLPGRTANDVKNYWNTNLRKKEVISREMGTSKVSKSLSRTEVIKPRPRTLSKSFILNCKTHQQELSQKKELPNIPSPSGILASDPWLPEKEREWWETVLEAVVDDGELGNSLKCTMPVGDSDLEQPLNPTDGERHCWGDTTFDDELWDLL